MALSDSLSQLRRHPPLTDVRLESSTGTLEIVLKKAGNSVPNGILKKPETPSLTAPKKSQEPRPQRHPPGEYNMSTIINVIYVIILVCVAWQDYKTRIIRNKFHIIIFSLAFVQMLLIPEYRMPDRLIGMLVVSVPMLLLTLLIPGGFGGGDIKLMAASGFLLGTSSILCAMNLAIIAGSIYGIIMLKNRKRDRKDQFAFGPFLAIGLSIATFWGNEIVSWYLKIQH